MTKALAAILNLMKLYFLSLLIECYSLLPYNTTCTHYLTKVATNYFVFCLNYFMYNLIAQRILPTAILPFPKITEQSVNNFGSKKDA